MRLKGVLRLLVVSFIAHLAAAACPALSVDFFPQGTKNVPAGWTRQAQVAAGNEDTSSLNTIKLSATPPPKLFVQPVHPLFSRKACVPADCLPAGKGRRLQEAHGQAISRPVHLTSSLSSSSVDTAAASEITAEQQQQRNAEGRNSLLWGVLGRRADSRSSRASSKSSQQGTEEVSSLAPQSSSTATAAESDGSTSSQLIPAAPATVGSADGAAGQKITDPDSGSGSSDLKNSLASAVDGMATGWTTWKEDDDSWWTGEDRSLQQCTTTVAQPASYDILWNIDGGVAKKATMPKQGAPFIELTNLDTLAPGKHTLNIKATMMKGTAEVNGVPSLQPPADQVYTTKVVFNLVEGKADAGPAVEPSDPKAATPAVPGDKPSAAVPGAAAAAGKKPAADATADPKAAPDNGTAPAEAVLPALEKPEGTRKGPDVDVEPSVNATVAQQAVKYYCMRQYNVGGKIHSQKNVTAGDDGVNQCAVACNALGQECGGFGVSVNKCFLMKAFNTSSSAADATLDALCMKSANDWLDFGIQSSANRVGGGFFCLRGYDIKGDPAGTGDMENPVQTANTELAGMTPSTCALQCKGTAGCQYFLMKKPTVPGGTATCYLKMHALGGLYGNTGPAKDTVDFTCFNGQEAWMTFGGQLDYAVPSPEVNTGVQTPALAAVTPSGGVFAGPSGAKTYRCIKGYIVNGTATTTVQVSLGDEGLSQCAGKCDADSTCVGYSTTEAGLCTLLTTINFNSSGPSPRTYGMCFGTAQDWNRFGNPDGSGMHCVKNYDFAGDGVRTVDYITITSGAGAVQFCKQQCAAEPQCQFSVTSLGKCFMKQNILSGSFGTTRPDTAVDASCVKGEQNWGLAALQVSAAPAGSALANGSMRGSAGPRKTTLRSAAGAPTQSSWLLLASSTAVATAFSALCL